ncbi:hypothetical protein BHE74_00045310 [Ensete ventricosum]|nr:hypothetical protein BHE74_00045310 [Ensete ventricosum]
MLPRLGDRDDAAGPGGSEIDLPSRSHAGDREKAPEGMGVGSLHLVAQWDEHLMLSVTFYVFQLQKLKVEPVLLHYLSRMGALKGCKIYLKPSRDRPAFMRHDGRPCFSLYFIWFCNIVYRSRIEDGDDYKAEGMPVQLHFPRRAHVSNKRCASCSLGYIGSSLPCEWVVSLVIVTYEVGGLF